MSNTKENAWNFTSLFIYFGLVIATGYGLQLKGIDIRDVAITELIIITLSIYRVTRVVVFEKIFKYFRDFVKHQNHWYVMRTLCFIIVCPWCAGVWIALIMVVFYFFVPYGVLIVYLMAISGVASFFVLLSNILNLDIKRRQKERTEE